MRESICTRVQPSTPVRENLPTQCPSPHRRASKSPPSPSQRANSCGPVALEEAPRSSPAAQHSRDRCPLQPPLSHEAYLQLPPCQAPAPLNHEACPQLPPCRVPHSHAQCPQLPPCLGPRPGPSRNPWPPSTAQQTTRAQTRHREHLLPLPLLPQQPLLRHQKSPPSRPCTTSPASPRASSVCARMKSSSSRRRKTTVRPLPPTNPFPHLNPLLTILS